MSHRLDQVWWRTATAADSCSQPLRLERQIVDSLRHEPLRLGEEAQLLEPGGEQRRPVLGLDAHLERLALAGRLLRVVSKQLSQGQQPVDEDACLLAARTQSSSSPTCSAHS